MANKCKEFYTASEKALQLSLYSTYPEKMARHFLAKERLRLGNRSAAYLCKVFSCSPKRIYAGLKELETISSSQTVVNYGKQRVAGGGAKKKKSRM